MKRTLGDPQNRSWQPSPTLHLAQMRNANNISIDDVATSTRINPLYLRAIEAEDFALLPGGIYAVSYIRQYAAAIGCDENNVLARFSVVASQDCPETANVLVLAAHFSARERDGASSAQKLWNTGLGY